MRDSDLPCVIVAEPIDGEVLSRLRCEAHVIELADSSPAALLEAVPAADALLVRMRSHVTARILNAAPRLRVIGRAGPSLDHIDLRAAQRRSITVVYTPRVQVQPIAEFTVALMLAAVRRVVWLDRRIREVPFDAIRTPCGRRMVGVTVGLLGAGAVAAEVGRILRDGFRAKVIFHSPPELERPDPEFEEVDFQELLHRSDLLSIHLPQGPRYAKIVNEAALAGMRPDAILVNASRGSAVDYAALAEALKTRRIAGAAIDVFDAEPLPAQHPLRTAPHCILTPHIGGMTADVGEEYQAVADDILRVLRGEPPRLATAGDGALGSASQLV